MPHGYSLYIIQSNKSASKRMIGVALGRACIANGVAVADVAERFGVSRQTVYNWFEGKHLPKPELLRQVSAYVAHLSK